MPPGLHQSGPGDWRPRRPEFRLYFWTPGSGPTLSQCHEMSLNIFTDCEQILRGGVISFKGLFDGKRALWISGRVPLAQLKKPSKSQKDSFLTKLIE